MSLWWWSTARASGVLFDPTGYAPALQLDVLVQIEERIESATLAWTFEVDAGSDWGFAQMVPTDAVVVSLRYRQDGDWIEASAQPAASAPASPEGTGAPLPGALQVQLPALQDGPLTVELGWQRVLTTTGGRLSTTIPLDDGGLGPADPVVTVQITADPGAPILDPAWGPSEPILAGGSLQASWTGPLSEHDALTLSWGEPPAPFGIRLLTYRPDLDPFTGEPEPDGYGLVLIQPGTADADVRVDQLFTFVLDTSASMDGPALDAAIAATERWLRSLRPEDRFDVVSYASVARPFRAKAPLAGPDAIEDAVAFLARQRPLGLSDPEEGLTTALQLMDDTVQQRSFFSCAGSSQGPEPGPPLPGQPVVTRAGASVRIAPYVVWITDGGATSGVQDTDAILRSVQAANTVGASLFTLGVGPDVDQVLMERIAADHRGGWGLAGGPDDVAVEVDALLTAVADPVLVQPRLRSADVRQQAPEALPDVGAGHEVLAAFRYPVPGEATLQLTGIRGPTDLDERYPITLPPRDDALPAIARTWAGLRVADLDARALAGEPVLAEIETLVSTYGVASEVVTLGFDGVPSEGATAALQEASGCGCTSAPALAGLGPLLWVSLIARGRRKQSPDRAKSTIHG